MTGIVIVLLSVVFVILVSYLVLNSRAQARKVEQMSDKGKVKVTAWALGDASKTRIFTRAEALKTAELFLSFDYAHYVVTITATNGRWIVERQEGSKSLVLYHPLTLTERKAGMTPKASKHVGVRFALDIIGKDIHAVDISWA